MTAKIQIAVVKAFLLTLADGTVKKFEEGLHEVEESIASHWYVEAHSTVVEPVAEPATDAPPPSDPPPPPSDAEPEPTEAQAATEAANAAVDKQLEAEAPKRKK